MASKIKVDEIETVDGSGNITVNQPLSGSGAGLTSLPAGNLTGTVADARISSLTASKLSGIVPTANLGTGTANATTFLNGSGAYSEAGGGAWTIIQTTEADDVASVTLTGISATYASYCIAVCDVVPASDDKRFYMKTGTSGTVDTGTYDYYLAGSSGTSSISYIYLMAEMGNAAGEGWSGMIWHNRPTTGNGRALFHFSGGSRNKDNNFTFAWGGGQKDVVQTVDRVKFQTSGGNITSGRFTLYGIAHA